LVGVVIKLGVAVRREKEFINIVDHPWWLLSTTGMGRPGTFQYCSAIQATLGVKEQGLVQNTIRP
jgi:hypothetical protein